MTASEKETAIHTYFNMWILRDFTLLESLLAPDITYSECYGPEYHGLHEIYLWIDAMLQKQKLLEWRIQRFIHEENTVVAEWFFMEQQRDIVNAFDGVSIIEFQIDGKISSIKELESKSDHITPYH